MLSKFNPGISEYLSDTLSYDWNITAQPNAKNTLLLGLEGHEDAYEFSASTGDLNNHAFLALWQHQHKAGTILSLSSREDHHSQFGSAFTYQGGLHHTLSKSDTRLYASYGTGFKAPTSYQSYNNPHLKAEKSEGWEIGFEQPFHDNQLQLAIAIFKKNIENLLIMFVGNLAPSIPMLPPHYPTDLKQGLRSIQAIPSQCA